MPLNTISISVIICSWQAPASLDETLETVFRQKTYVIYEVILVNNGFSQSRADQLKAAYPELRILDEPTPGLAHARCTGFRAARGDFFACIDDDNFLEEGFLSSLANLISKFPNLGCISPVVLPRWEQVALRSGYKNTARHASATMHWKSQARIKKRLHGGIRI